MRAPVLLHRVGPALVTAALLAGCGTSSVVQGRSGAAPSATASPADPTQIDWKPLAYDALGCHSREQWIADDLPVETWDDAPYEVVAGEVTEDGDPDAVLTIACPQGMGMSSAAVLVFDRVAEDARVVDVLDAEMNFQMPSTSVEDRTIVLEGPTVAGRDAMCCAEHWGRAEYQWMDGGFALVHAEEAFTSRPISHEGLLDGSYTGNLRAVDDREILIDLVEWFEGDAALAACAEDGVDAQANAWCSMYYVREGDDQVHALRVAGTATVSYLDHTGEERPAAAVTDLRSTDSISDGPEHVGRFRVRVEDGVVVDLREVFTP